MRNTDDQSPHDESDGQNAEDSDATRTPRLGHIFQRGELVPVDCPLSLAKLQLPIFASKAAQRNSLLFQESVTEESVTEESVVVTNFDLNE